MSLVTSYDEIQREVGLFLGAGRTPSSWTADAAADIAAIIKAGQRRLYWPMVQVQKFKDGPVKQERYVWSFMRSQSTIAITSGTNEYQLPGDIADVSSSGLSYGAGTKKRSVSRISHDDLLALRAETNKTGDPEFYSVRAVPVPGNANSKQTPFTIALYPTPAESTTLIYSYVVTPLEMSDDNQYPLGGPHIAQALIEACLAEAEKTLDDEEGLHEKRFRELLLAAIEYDKELANPELETPWVGSSDTTITKDYLKKLIGDLLGYGPNPLSWSSPQAAKVDIVLAAGLRKFYNPQVLPGEKYNWDWSFLKPTKLLNLLSSVDKYDLPEDFCMLRGDKIVYMPGQSVIYPPITIVPERMVVEHQSSDSGTALPRIACYRPKDTPSGAGTSYELLVYPKPDQNYQVSVPYAINPALLADDTHLPYGGPVHAQTIIEACLCAGEEAIGQRGVHADAYLTCLRASVSQDRKLSSPESLGFNREQPDRSVTFGSWHDCDANIVTYNGLSY